MGAMFVVRLKTPAIKIAAGLGLLVLVAGCTPSPKQAANDDTTHPTTSSASTTSERSTPPPTPPPAPDTDVCRQLRIVGIGRYSNTTPTTACSKPHTAFTFDVTRLPPDIAFEGVQIKNDAIQQQAAESCRTSFVDYVGGDAATRARVRLTVTYFLPDQAGFDAGAHWVRCDIIALKAERILADLPAKLEGLLDDESAVDDYGLCSTAEPGTVESTLVMCSQPHAYRAIAALRLGATDDPYPGDTTTNIEGKQRCEDLIVDLLGTDGGFTYSWTFPTAQDWKLGQRFGYCWNKLNT